MAEECQYCGKREPQTQNTDDTNIGMIEGYAQNIIDMCEAYREGIDYLGEGVPGKRDMVDGVREQVAYLADHLAAL